MVIPVEGRPAKHQEDVCGFPNRGPEGCHPSSRAAAPPGTAGSLSSQGVWAAGGKQTMTRDDLFGFYNP